MNDKAQKDGVARNTTKVKRGKMLLMIHDNEHDNEFYGMSWQKRYLTQKRKLVDVCSDN